jgi:hypothetical protein
MAIGRESSGRSILLFNLPLNLPLNLDTEVWFSVGFDQLTHLDGHTSISNS